VRGTLVDSNVIFDILSDDEEWIDWSASMLADAKRSSLPDFYIGAHAAVAGLTLLTRDSKRYKTYLPGLSLLCP
jgi:predicted nucleic acid-binding protein